MGHVRMKKRFHGYESPVSQAERRMIIRDYSDSRVTDAGGIDILVFSVSYFDYDLAY